MAARARFVPGNRVAIATDDAWLLVDLPVEHDMVQRCWWRLSQNAEVDDLLDVLVSAGVRSVPSFALVGRAGGQRRAVAHGAGRVLTGADAAVVAASPRGWADEPLPEFATVTLTMGDAAGPPELAMTHGVTMASDVTVETIDVDAATTAGYRPPPGAAESETPGPGGPDPMDETTDFTPFEAFTDTERIGPAGVPGIIDGLPWTPTAPDGGVQRAALPIVGPSVVAGHCPAGHLSPPHVLLCRVCQAPMPPQTGFEIGRPVLGVLHLSTGDEVTLDRGVLFGRAPEIPPGLPERPNIVKLASPENDISRTHAMVTLDGWFVHVVDLGATNGTTVTLPGRQPVRLRPHDQHLLEPGAQVSLADEVSFVFEVTP